MSAPSESSTAGGSRPAPDPSALAELGARLAAARPLLVVAPPRSASTAFARIFQQHSAINRYVHEPCGLYSYENTTLATVLDELDGLAPRALVKEMTFQFRELVVAEEFFRHCHSPTIFLARSPLLTISSRIRMVLTDLIRSAATSARDIEQARAAIEAQDYSEVDGLLSGDRFPINRTGWTDLAEQLELCRTLDLDHIIVETTNLRREPETTLKTLCPRLGLSYEPGMIEWDAREAPPAGSLDRHSIWYTRVDESTGVIAPVEQVLPIDRFPTRFRSHLNDALATYELSIADPRCI